MFPALARPASAEPPSLIPYLSAAPCGPKHGNPQGARHGRSHGTPKGFQAPTRHDQPSTGPLGTAPYIVARITKEAIFRNA